MTKMSKRTKLLSVNENLNLAAGVGWRKRLGQVCPKRGYDVSKIGLLQPPSVSDGNIPELPGRTVQNEVMGCPNCRERIKT
jgi:hypothetical protein